MLTDLLHSLDWPSDGQFTLLSSVGSFPPRSGLSTVVEHHMQVAGRGVEVVLADATLHQPLLFHQVVSRELKPSERCVVTGLPNRWRRALST